MEFINGSIVKTIVSDDNVRSKRGQEQLKLVGNYYKSKKEKEKING
jgi:hypothetical protein